MIKIQIQDASWGIDKKIKIEIEGIKNRPKTSYLKHVVNYVKNHRLFKNYRIYHVNEHYLLHYDIENKTYSIYLHYVDMAWVNNELKSIQHAHDYKNIMYKKQLENMKYFTEINTKKVKTIFEKIQ